MPERPDYAALTRGQIAVLDRINAGETGLPVVQRVVRLAQDVLGGRGAGFVEYAPDHGRIIAATGACASALGRRVEREDSRLRGGRTLLVPLNSLNDEFAKQIDGGDLHRMLGARCEVAMRSSARCTSTSPRARASPAPSTTRCSSCWPSSSAGSTSQSALHRRGRRRPGPPAGKPRPLGRGHQPRAAHPGHRHQGLRGHPHQPLGVARRRRPPGGRPGGRRPGRRAGPAGRPAALRGQRGRRGRRRRRPARSTWPRRCAARSASCPPTCGAASMLRQLPGRAAEGVRRARLDRHHPHRAGHQRREVLAARTPRSSCAPAPTSRPCASGSPTAASASAPSTSSARSSATGRPSRGDRRRHPGAGLGPLPGAPAGGAPAGLGVAAPARGRRHRAEVRLPRA